MARAGGSGQRDNGNGISQIFSHLAAFLLPALSPEINFAACTCDCFTSRKQHGSRCHAHAHVRSSRGRRSSWPGSRDTFASCCIRARQINNLCCLYQTQSRTQNKHVEWTDKEGGRERGRGREREEKES